MTRSPFLAGSLIAGLTALLLAGATAQAEPMTLKISTQYPDGTRVVNRIKQAGEEISQKTGGAVKLKVYAGGVQGDDATVLRKIRTGQLHGALTQGGAVAAAYKDIQVYNVPLAFRSFAEVDYVRGKMDGQLRGELEKTGWVSFGLIEGGFAYVMSNAPVATVDELRRQKLWIPANDPASEQAAKSWGIAPIVLPIADVLTSLQTGAINAFAAPSTAAIALQWYSRVKFRTEVPLLYTFGLLSLSDKYFGKLDAAQQKVVRDALMAASAELDKQARKDNLDAAATLDKAGIKTIKPSDAQYDQWEQLALKATDDVVARGELGAPALNQFRKHLAEFRTAGKAAPVKAAAAAPAAAGKQ